MSDIVPSELSGDDLIVDAVGLSKTYGQFQALKPCSFSIPPGRVVGIFGPNGAGKTTLLNALLGLHDYDGQLKLLGRDPYKHRAKLMEHVSFISDVATLPRWMSVSDILRYVSDVHPRFDEAAALERLQRHTRITPGMKIKNLSKGMVVQLHLSLVLAIDSRLLVLDEPTLGLDVLHRRSLYDALIEEFFDNNRSIIVTTHHIDEIEQILTHVMFLRDGEIILDTAIEDLAGRFMILEASPANAEAAQALGPIASRTGIGRSNYIYDGVDRSALAPLGDVRRATLTELFIAQLGHPAESAEAASGATQT